MSFFKRNEQNKTKRNKTPFLTSFAFSLKLISSRWHQGDFVTDFFAIHLFSHQQPRLIRTRWRQSPAEKKGKLLEPHCT